MSCKICARSSCTESFHSIAEQKAFERAEEMSIQEVSHMILNEIDYEAKIRELEKDCFDLREALNLSVPQTDYDQLKAEIQELRELNKS